jgi:hypothetical protein
MLDESLSVTISRIDETRFSFVMESQPEIEGKFD